MRCLYCGKELALLKRLTGSGQFCSEAHKVSYHDEYNRIALSRLLQAQTKPTPPKPLPSKEARLPEKEPAKVEVAQEKPAAVEAVAETLVAPQAVAETPATPQAVAETPATQAAVLVADAVEQEVAAPAAAEQSAEERFEPTEIAGVIPDRRPVPMLLEAPLYSEPWQQVVLTPTGPAWLFEGRPPHELPTGAVLPLLLRPKPAVYESPVPEAKVTPNEFVPTKAKPPVLAAITVSNTLTSAGPVDLKAAPKNIEYTTLASVDGICEFPVRVVFEDAALLDPLPSEIAFPAEDADVPLISEGGGEILEQAGEANARPSIDEAPVAQEENSPRAALEALARLHEELVVEPEAAVEAASPMPLVDQTAAPVVEQEPVATEEQAATPVAVLVAEPAEPTATEEEAATPVAVVAEPAAPVVEQQPVATEEEAATLVAVEAHVDVAEQPAQEPQEATPAAEQREPSKAAEMIEIPVKTFAPPKPSPVDSPGAQVEAPTLLPRLTGLPLRPKIGLASPQTAQSLTAAQKKNAPADAQPKPAASGGAWRAPEPAKPASNETPAAQVSQPATPAPVSQPSKAQLAPVAKIDTPAEVKNTPPAPATKQAQQLAEVPAKTKSRENEQKPKDGKKSAESATAKKGANESSAPDHETPNFGAMQGGSSMLGSLKAKLAIAGVAVAMAVGAYFTLGGKSHAPAAKPAAAADKAGPSIMVGGGGWVESWAGDPVGAHFGRQITMYRPSLKLSDYRIEFQGQIETKSLGWVFRAADPENYYAMKLTMVSAGLSPKIALFKYLVANGRQTQVGRVPIDQAVRLDTLYSVRVDVEGPRFTTYVQGQQADIWTDDQLKSGGVGFLNEREERGRVKSVSVSLLNGGKQQGASQ